MASDTTSFGVRRVLRGGEAGFRLLTEHFPDISVLAFGPDLRVWAATGAALRCHGVQPEQLVGRPVPELTNPAAVDLVTTCCRAALAGERRQLDLPGRSDPSVLWAVDVVPLCDDDGVVTDGMLIARDVTEQRRAEQALRTSQRQLAEAQRVAQVGGWEWDLASGLITLSDQLREILGAPGGSVHDLDRAIDVMVHPADRPAVRRTLGRASTDIAPVSLEHRVVRPDGSVRTVLARGEGVPDDTGRIVRVVGTDQDVTDLRRADAERRRLLGRLYQLQEGQDRTLAADLHDGHVQGLAALGLRLEQARLRLGAAGEPEVHALLWQAAEDLSAEIASLRRTIGRLRPFVLDQEGLEAALREEAAHARARAPLLACEVTSELAGQRFDPATETALFRVAQQALANVTDHAQARCAAVDLCWSEDGVALFVADDGQGFDPEHVRVLGEVHSFGLIAMRERVEALGGRFSLATAPGRGTRVEAWVPAARAAAEGGPA